MSSRLRKIGIQVAFIDAPLTDLVSRMKDVEDAGTTLPLVFRKPPSELDHFVPFQDIVAPVNAQLTSQIGREETARLVDLLFSPTLARWDPFYHNLDFRRSIGTRMLDSLLKLAVTGRNLPAPILRWVLVRQPGNAPLPPPACETIQLEPGGQPITMHK